jgi:hypothetical protein
VIVAPQHICGGMPVFSFLCLIYGFLTMFVTSSLARNRRDGLPDAPVLAFAGHGLMAASATGACLALGAAAWTAIAA